MSDCVLACLSVCLFHSRSRTFETLTGVDIDGDGKTDADLPDFNPETHEISIVLSTIEGGHNSGRAYVHVVDNDQAHECIGALQAGWKIAKARHRASTLEAIYGHSKLSMCRAKTRFIYQSDAFQLLTAFFIITGFLVDVGEAQVCAIFRVGGLSLPTTHPVSRSNWSLLSVRLTARWPPLFTWPN